MPTPVVISATQHLHVNSKLLFIHTDCRLQLNKVQVTIAFHSKCVWRHKLAACKHHFRGDGVDGVMNVMCVVFVIACQHNLDAADEPQSCFEPLYHPSESMTDKWREILELWSGRRVKQTIRLI